MGDTDKHLLAMKGALEIVFAKCKTILIDGEDVEINESTKKQFREASEKLAGMGQRVLGQNSLTSGLCGFPS